MTNQFPTLTFFHFFTTGPSLEFDEIYQAGVITYRSDVKAPNTRGFNIRPLRKFTNRQFYEGGVSAAELNDSKLWLELFPLLEAEFYESDIIFYYGNLKDTERLKKLFPKNITDKLVNLKLVVQLLFPYFEKFNLKSVAKAIYRDFKQFKPGIEPQLAVLKDFCLFAYDRYLNSESLRFFVQNTNVLTTEDLLIHFIGKVLPSLHEYESFQINQSSLLLEAAKEPVNLELLTRNILRSKFLNDLPVEPDKADWKEQTISPETIENYLHQGIGSFEKNFEKRTEQIEYALAVTDALNNKETLLIEAGTGTGKTLGYLLPAMEYLRLNPGKRIIISTAMKNLQHQIFWNEMTRIKRFFPEAFGHVKISILKGKSNYLCIGNLKKWLKSQWSEGLFQHSKDEFLASLYLLNLASHRNLVDIESIPVEVQDRFPEMNEWIEHLRSDIVCFKGSCNHSPSCLYDLNLREADKSQLIIVNHAKFLNLPPNLLTNTAAIIIDEADLFAGYLKSSLSVDISSWDIRKLLSAAYSKKARSGWLRALKSTKSSLVLDDIDSFLQVIERGFQQLTASFSRKTPRRNANIYLPEIQDITTDYELRSEMKVLLEPIDDLYTLVTHAMSNGDLKISDEYSTSFHVFFNKLESLHDGLNSFCSDYPTKTYCHYFSIKDDNWNLGKRAVYLHDKFKHSMHDTIPGWIFTSATLTLDGKFDHFISELGLTMDEVSTERVSSPFKYEEQAALIVSEWIPQFSFENTAVRDKWNQLIAGTSGLLSAACNGRTLILCTSYEQMNFIYQAVSGELESIGITVLKQEGASIDVINEFFENEHSVLLGVDRLWTGVDFPGSTLSQLIIVKLPFNPMDDPEMKHRHHVDKQFFWDYYNGLAKLKFRQGVGRLIRSKKDNGVVVVLDQRLLNPKNKMFIRNLPNMPVHNYASIDDCVDFVLRKIGLKSEYMSRKAEIEPVLEKFRTDYLSLRHNNLKAD